MDDVNRGLADIRAKAHELRDCYGDDGRARTLEWAAQRIEAALGSDGDRLLSVGEAARRSGCSVEHLGRLVREGKIPDARPAGSRGRLVFRTRDVPLKTISRYIGECRDSRSSQQPFSRQGGAIVPPRKCWTKTVGAERGTHVRVYERRPAGPIQIAVWIEGSTVGKRKSLGHRDKVRAEQQARAIARLRVGGPPPSALERRPATLGELLEGYHASSTHTRQGCLKTEQHRKEWRGGPSSCSDGLGMTASLTS
jgi:excisionase family DNA binding protein